jgi:glycosyltransferase involved in cell wall biosynthesis
MKLLFYDFNIPYLLKDSDVEVGGACVRQYAFAKGLMELGHKVGILTWSGAKKYVGPNSEFDLVECYSLNGGIRKLRWIYNRFPSLIKEVNNYKPDVLIQKGAGGLTGIMAIIAQLLNIRFVFLATNDIDADNRYKLKLNTINRILYRNGLRRTNLIICQNSYQLQQFKEKYHNKRLSIIHNPYFQFGESINIKNTNKREYIAWIGIFQKQKNLRALYNIVLQTPHIDYKIAGKEAVNADDYTQSALSDLRKCKNVEFVGYLRRSEISHFLSKSIALLNTSYFEGFSNTFLEAWAAGTPVITTKDVNPDNIIRDYELGRVAKNYGDIARILDEYIKASDFKAMTIRCNKYMSTNHNPTIIASQFIDEIKYL